MASYDAAINLIVNGGSKIDQIINKAAQLEGIVNSLNKTPLDLSVKKATSEFDKFDTNLKALKAEIGNQQKALDAAANSIDKYTDKIVSTQRQLSALNPNTKKYNEVLERQQRAIEGLAGAQKALASAEQNLATQEGKLAGTQKAAGRAKATKLATEALSNLADEYLRLGAAQEKGATGQILKNQSQSTIARLAAQADALKLVADNSEIASSQFNRFVIASQLASQKIYEGRQKQLGALAFGLSKEAPGVNIGTGGKSSIAAARDTIDSLIGSYGGVVKSEAALSSYISRLQSLQSLVPYLSEEYSKLELAIAEVSMEMDSLQKQTKFLGAVSKIQPQAGPASLLPSESVKSAADKAKYYSKIDDQVSRLAGFEERIAQANLTQTQKLELRARLDKALSLLSENRLDDAKRETIEIERQRMSLERMNRASKPASEIKPLGPSTALGTGAELRERNKYEAEGIRLRDKIAKATNDAAAAVQRLEAAQDRISFVQQFEEIQAGIKDVGDEVDKFLQKEKKATADFGKSLREATKTIKQVKQGAAVDLGGGAELKERAKFDQSREQNARKLNNIIASGVIVEQGLINLQGKGVDVTETLIRLQQSLNSAKKDDFEVTQQTVDALGDQVSLAGKFAQLQNKILAGQAKGGKTQSGGSGLEAALKSLQEARGARQTFLGGASPAEAIDKIVREFNAGKTAIGNAGQNAASTFVGNIKGAAGSAASAGKTFASSAAKAILKVFGIASPSRFMIELVKNLADTYVSQIQKEYPRIKAATARAFGEETLLRDVTKLRATNKGFEEYGRPSTGFKPLPAGAGTSGATSEFNNLINSFRKQIAELTTQPQIYGNILNALPNSRITTDLIGAANRRAAASEIPSFMSTQRMLGPGELERFITAELAKYLKDIKIPNPWIGAIGDYKQFIAKVISETDKLRVPPSGIRSLPQGQIAGLLPAAKDLVGNKFEERIRQAFERSAQRGAAVFAENASRRVGTGVAAIGGGVVPPGVPPGGGSGGGIPAGGGDAVSRTARLLGFDAIADISRVSTRELEALSAAASELRAILDPTIEGFDRLDNQLRETIGSIDRQLQRRDPNADFLTRRIGPRAGSAISEGLIGGAFPLLFGQGVGASIGGLAGGAAGGFAGGGLGFGLSLIGTALGTAFDTFIKNATDLGKSLKDPTASLEAMKTSGLRVSDSLERNVKLLIESGEGYKAQSLVLAELNKQLGPDGLQNIQKLTSEQKKLEDSWKQLTANITSFLLPAATDFIGIVGDIVSGLNELSKLQIPDWLLQAGAASARIGFGAMSGGTLAAFDTARAIQRTKREGQGETPATRPPLSPDLIISQRQTAGTTEQLRAQADLLAKALALTGMTLEKDGQRYIIASKSVAQQEYDNKLLEIKNNWIGKIFNKEQNLAQIRAANLEYAARLKQLNEEIAQRQQQVANNVLQAELAGYQQRQKTIELLVDYAAFEQGTEAGLKRQLDLTDQLYYQKLSEFYVEEQIALAEAAKNGTLKETEKFYQEKLTLLKNEVYLQKEITKQRIAQIELDKLSATAEIKRSAVEPFANFRQSQELDRRYSEDYYKLLKSGIMPAEAERRANFNRLSSESLTRLDREIAIKEVLLQQAKNLKVSADEINKITKDIADLRAGRAGVLDEILKGPGAEQGKIPGMEIQQFISSSIESLNNLETVAIRVSQSIGDAVGGAMNEGINSLIDGTMTAQEVFANFLKNVSQILMQEATKMIATYIAIGLAKQFAGLFGGGSSSFFSGASGLESGSFSGSQGIFGNINPGIDWGQTPGIGAGSFNSSIAPFAMGGAFTNSIVTAPTLFKFANGGTMSTGVMGDAGPEAVMPLTRGPDGRLGVQASGGGGAVVNGDINITVENTGDTLSPAAQKQIAGQVQGIVLATLADQKRGGGMLR